MTIAIGVVKFSGVFMAVFLMILRNEAAAKRHFLGYHHWYNVVPVGMFVNL